MGPRSFRNKGRWPFFVKVVEFRVVLARCRGLRQALFKASVGSAFEYRTFVGTGVFLLCVDGARDSFFNFKRRRALSGKNSFEEVIFFRQDYSNSRHHGLQVRCVVKVTLHY